MNTYYFHGLLIFFIRIISSSSGRQWLSEVCQWEQESFTEDNQTLYMQVLLPCRKPHILSLSQVGPGIILGIDHSRELLKPWKIQLQYHDTMCSNSLAPYQAVEVHKTKRLHVLMGPAFDFALAGVARFVKYWNIPLITAGGFASAFHEDKRTFDSEFYLLTKTGFSQVGVCRAIVDLGRMFKWSKYKLLFQRNTDSYPDLEDFCQILLSTFTEVLKAEKAGMFSSYNWDDGKDDETQKEKAERVLKQEVGNEYGVILMCLSRNVTRDIFLAAEELNMIDSGEYVFFIIELFANRYQDPKLFNWFQDGNEPTNTRMERALTSVFLVSAYFPDTSNSAFGTFFHQLNHTSTSYFNISNDDTNAVTLGFYDAVTVYTQVIHEILKEGNDVTNGSLITSKMRNRTFTGRLGPISMDINGNRLTDYSLLDFNPKTNLFEPVMYYNGTKREFSFENGKLIHWPGGKSGPPLDTPPCGYNDAKCASKFPRYVIAVICLLSAFFVFGVIGFFIYRRVKEEAKLMSMSWKVRWEDVVFTQPGKRNCWDSRVDVNQKISFLDLRSTLMDYEDHLNVTETVSTGFFKENTVAVKKLQVGKIEVTRAFLLEMKTLQNLQCEHLVRFVGACIDAPNQCLLTEYCTKGSLHSILDNDEIQLDLTFRTSLMNDIVEGMKYLHNSDIKSHGRLTSLNCVVDSRFVLKICDFGLNHLRAKIATSLDWEQEIWKKKLWTAPELLRSPYSPPQGTQKGDVYSFAIVLHEIVMRQGPFNLNKSEFSLSDIIEKVSFCEYPPFRPSVEQASEFDVIVKLMEKCWMEDPDDRPDFRTIQSINRASSRNNNQNILDNLLARMEQYANNLESLVEERTADYLEEKKKCEQVLYQLLPKSVACNLIQGKTVNAEAFDEVSIYFSDIVGFTSLSATSTPMQVVELLNDLYTCFDSVIENFDVYKVETIGDAYMVVSGLPVRNGNSHAPQIARMSLALLKKVETFQIRHKPEEKLKLRIGLHSGSCVAGIVGLKMPRYCLFGDTVNTASRMESTGIALKIHISAATKEMLDIYGCFITEFRGKVEAKGKGELTTYWLIGEKDSDQSLLNANLQVEDLE